MFCHIINLCLWDAVNLIYSIWVRPNFYNKIDLTLKPTCGIHIYKIKSSKWRVSNAQPILYKHKFTLWWSLYLSKYGEALIGVFVWEDCWYVGRCCKAPIAASVDTVLLALHLINASQMDILSLTTICYKCI